MSSDEDTRDRLARMETKIDILVEDLAERVKDHETRIRLGERWRYALPMSVLVAAGSLVVTLLSASGGGSPH